MDASAVKLLGAGIAVLGVIGSGIGIGSIFAAYIQAVARNPAARRETDMFTMTMLGFALVEALALFALIIALLLLFVF
jgi:F-type H+-transporting ATPase subunit c